MDGEDYHRAVREHKNGVNMQRLREHLQAYRDGAVSFVRDGGDRFGVSEAARALAPEYGIAYCTPLFAIHREGHYGHIVGKSASSLAQYRSLVEEVRRRGGDFIKIMVSGLIDYRACGLLSEEALEREWITQMVHIAHEEGFAVMAHANGRDAVLPAVLAGVDSIEHGNYIDRDCLEAMADTGCVWVPTIATTANLLGCGRYDDEALRQIYEAACETLSLAWQLGVQTALGSDAGAYLVPHGRGVADEYAVFQRVWPGAKSALDAHLRRGEARIRSVFAKEKRADR